MALVQHPQHEEIISNGQYKPCLNHLVTRSLFLKNGLSAHVNANAVCVPTTLDYSGKAKIEMKFFVFKKKKKKRMFPL